MMRMAPDRIEDHVSTVCSPEFLDGGVDYESLERLHRSDVQQWVLALTQCGRFAPSMVAEAELAWRRNPKQLLELLLTHADEMTVRRCRITWASLDRLAPLVPPLPVQHFG